MQIDEKRFISDLDTARFGFKVAKIDDFSIDLAAALAGLRRQGVRLVMCRPDAARPDLIAHLEDLGFRLKDAQLTYRYDLERLDFSAADLPENFLVRPAHGGDVDALVDIARQSFDGYGHYFADTRLDRVKCLEIYMDWARRSCLEKEVADKIFLVQKEGQIVGFMTFRLEKKEGRRFASGGLGAVLPQARGMGVFPTAVRAGLLWGAELGLEWEEHNALITNIPVNRSFANMGFRVAAAWVTMHCWLDGDTEST